MNTIFSLVVTIQVVSAVIIIGLVLIQHGKGADMGAAFGSGASGSLFGATGSSSFLSKATGIAATIFFCMTLALAYFGNRYTAPVGGVMDNLPVPTSKVPAIPVNGVVQPAALNAPVTASAPAAGLAPATASAVKPASTGHADQIPK